MLIFQKSVDRGKGKTIGNALQSVSSEVTDSKAVENHHGCSSRMKQTFMEVQLWLILNERHQNITECSSRVPKKLYPCVAPYRSEPLWTSLQCSETLKIMTYKFIERGNR